MNGLTALVSRCLVTVAFVLTVASRRVGLVESLFAETNYDLNKILFLLMLFVVYCSIT